MSHIRLTVVAIATSLMMTAVLSVAAAASTSSLVLDGVRVALPVGTHQVITVRHTVGTYARAVFWTQTASGRWVIGMQTSDARTGAGGLVAGDLRRQGTDTTPTGTYTIPFGFGVDTVPGAIYPYHRLTNADWWVEDNASLYYNRLRSSLIGFRWWLSPELVNSSEHLIGYRQQYDLVLVIAFNYYQPVRYRGAGIFFHVNGNGATGGCVSAPRWFVYNTIYRLQASERPVIAIG